MRKKYLHFDHFILRLKKTSPYLPYISILFALIYLSTLDHSLFLFPRSPLLCLASLILLILVHTFRAFIWKQILSKFHINISFKLACISFFKSILAKYIPGKVWLFFSRSLILSTNGHSTKKTVFIAFLAQIISIISGFFIGLMGFAFLQTDISLFPPRTSLFLILSIALGVVTLFFTTILPIKYLKKIPLLRNKIVALGDDSTLPPLFDILFGYLGTWICLGLAYTMFFSSMGVYFGVYPIFFQPLANNLGIIAIFAPGGLGVREGAMVGYMILIGIPIETAIMLALMARLWFFISETLIFVVGAVLDISNKRSLEDS